MATSETLSSGGAGHRGRGGLAATLATLAALWLASGCAAQTKPAPLRTTPDGRPLVLTFSDDFTQFRPWADGRGVWRTVYGSGAATSLDQRTIKANAELQLYVDQAIAKSLATPGLDPFLVHDGVLTISADRTPPSLRPNLGGYGYTSGVITSQPSFSQTYGYFEMRARLPAGKGLWPAFWMLPADMSWPPEIDIMESVGDPSVVYVTAHSRGVKAVGVAAHASPGAFHTFAVSWDAKSLIWYVDGRQVARQPTPSDLNKPMFLVANLAVGGGWAGAPDDSTAFPAHYDIAFIRAYRFAQ